MRTTSGVLYLLLAPIHGSQWGQQQVVPVGTQITVVHLSSFVFSYLPCPTLSKDYISFASQFESIRQE